MDRLTHLDLFSGIAGFALAAQWAGFETVGFSEVEDFCSVLLEERFPGVKNYGDITRADFSELTGRITVLTGGFPCQPWSLAGKRAGTADRRHLWPAMLATISVVRPTWVIGENVPGILGMGQIEAICDDLEGVGYDSQTFVVPANAVGADHLRYRVFIVAHSSDSHQQHDDNGRHVSGPLFREQSESAPLRRSGESISETPSDPALRGVRRRVPSGATGLFACLGEDAAHAHGAGLEIDQPRENGHQREALKRGGKPSPDAEGERWGEAGSRRCGQPEERAGWGGGTDGIWGGFAQPSLRGGPSRTAGKLDDAFARVASTPPLTQEKIPFRADRLKALGNAVVPQCVLPFLQAIARVESECPTTP